MCHKREGAFGYIWGFLFCLDFTIDLLKKKKKN